MFNHHTALWGRPFHYCRVSAGAGRAAWRTHEPHAWCITSIVMGPWATEPRRRCVVAKTDAGARLSVLLHAPDARAHVELRALALEVRVAVDAALVGQLHALLGSFAALHALRLSQAVQ